MESELISQSLIESTYLFCYKRLQNSYDAEDLTQDIIFEALKALNIKKSIDYFYSWYWAMAKNRFNMFLRMKQHHAVELESVCDCLPDDANVEYEIFKSDELNNLNYMISRLSHLHREIIILYYLKELKITQIAKTLSVPEGTVKRRLFDAKNTIKEGMINMPNCGRSSYAPAELNLWGGYSLPNYWNHINDIMTKQIFAVCSKRSKTTREIADEIGVAPVYFEEKLKYLLDNRFIKETVKGSYITDFCIYSKQIRSDFWFELSEIYDSIGREMTDAILNCEKEIRALDFYGNDFPMGKLLWIFYCEAADMLSRSMLEIYNGKWQGKIPENNGKSYRIAGQLLFPDESIKVREHKQNSLAWSNIHNHFKTSGYSNVEYANLFQCEPFSERDHIINESNADFFMRIYDNPNIFMTPNEEETAANLICLDYLHKKNGGLYLSVPVMSFDCKSKLHELFRKATSELAFKYVESVSALSDKILLPATRKDLIEEYAHFIITQAFFPIGYLYWYGTNAEPPTLDIPTDYSKSSNGICIYYKK